MITVNSLIINGFWSSMTGFVPLVVPIVGFLLVWRLIKDLLLK